MKIYNSLHAFQIEAKKEMAKLIKKRHKDLQIWNDVLPKIQDESLVRQFKLYSVLGSAILSDEKYAEVSIIKFFT